MTPDLMVTALLMMGPFWALMSASGCCAEHGAEGGHVPGLFPGGHPAHCAARRRLAVRRVLPWCGTPPIAPCDVYVLLAVLLLLRMACLVSSAWWLS